MRKQVRDKVVEEIAVANMRAVSSELDSIIQRIEQNDALWEIDLGSKLGLLETKLCVTRRLLLKGR